MGFLSVRQKIQLNLKNLVSVTTDGAPATFSSKNRFVSLSDKHANEIRYKHGIFKFYCIIHEALMWKSTKSAGFSDIMKVVVKAVNFIYHMR